jgi:hypothetical protein
MTEKTNGKLPLDGMSTISPHSEWRVYPFKRILELYNPNSNMDQSDNAARQIYYHWNEIDQSMAELYMNVVKGSQMSGQMKIFPWQDDKVAKLVFGLAGPIFKHIHEYRKKGSDHLYSCFPVTK